MSRVQMQLTTEATYQLEGESQGQAPPSGSKCNTLQMLLTNWRSMVSRLRIQLTIEATHYLENQGHVLSAGSKCSSPQKQLTDWGAEDNHH